MEVMSSGTEDVAPGLYDGLLLGSWLVEEDFSRNLLRISMECMLA